MKERLSAWMDGELSDEEARPLLSELKRGAELRANWDCYHLIGDALRGVWGPDLSAKLCAWLDAEPTVIAPRRRGTTEWLRWRPLQVAASIAAVALVGFIWIVLPDLRQDPPQIAAIPEPKVKQVAVTAGEGVKDYVLAHQRYSPSNAMQGIATYVRTVTDFRSPPVLSPQPSPFSTPRIRPGVGLAATICLRLCSE